MGIVYRGSIQEVERYCVEVITILNEEIRQTLAYTCEEAVGKIRDRSGAESWNDDTGNLRSSIGYGIYEYGKELLSSAFPVVKDGTEGHRLGQEIISDLAGLYSQTYAAVVIAGMDYAEKVENMKNKDVLNNTFEWAKGVIYERLQKAVERAQLRVMMEL